MKLGFLSPQTAAVARDVSLLDLLSELIDANADTVQLITGDPLSTITGIPQVRSWEFPTVG